MAGVANVLNSQNANKNMPTIKRVERKESFI